MVLKGIVLHQHWCLCVHVTFDDMYVIYSLVFTPKTNIFIAWSREIRKTLQKSVRSVPAVYHGASAYSEFVAKALITLLLPHFFFLPQNLIAGLKDRQMVH